MHRGVLFHHESLESLEFFLSTEFKLISGNLFI